MIAAAEVDSIDDNLKERGVSVVKTSSQEQIQLYDIDVLPKLVYFEVIYYMIYTVYDNLNLSVSKKY